MLDKLPAGYTLYQKPRIGTPKHVRTSPIVETKIVEFL